MVGVVHFVSSLIFFVDGALSLLHKVAHAVRELVLGRIQEHKDAVNELERAQSNLAKLGNDLILVLILLYVVRAQHHD